MVILKRTEDDTRRVLKVTRHGVEAHYQRASTTGGYYTRDMVFVPWPWVKTS